MTSRIESTQYPERIARAVSASGSAIRSSKGWPSSGLPAGAARGGGGSGGDEAGEDGYWPDPEPIELEITDVLDLHSFPPREVPSIVREYLDAAYERGLRRLRIVHGRGVGVQRNTVRTLLGRDPRVTAFGDADASGGGWGATWVEME